MALEKRSLRLTGHATSMALEPQFWAALEALAARRQTSLASLVREIDLARGDAGLASACRVAVLKALTESPSPLAGEGVGAADG